MATHLVCTRTWTGVEMRVHLIWHVVTCKYKDWPTKLEYHMTRKPTRYILAYKYLLLQ